MKVRYYQISYSGREYEGARRFYKLARLKKFLQKIPQDILKDTQAVAWDGKYWYVGQYFILKKGGLSVKF